MLRPRVLAIALTILARIAPGAEPVVAAPSAPTAPPPPAAEALAVVEKGPFCSPLFAAGVVLGISEESDVLALLGPGVVVPPRTNDRARAHLDPTGKIAMITEIGTDSFVASITLVWAKSLPEAVLTQLAGHGSPRMRRVGTLGPAGMLSLGLTSDEIRSRFGAPSRVEGTQAEPRWTYLTDYAPTECIATENVTLTFRDGAVAEIELEGAD